MRDTAIVTGGCGFIGSWVAQHLIELGKHVVVVDDLSGGYPENLPNGAELYKSSILNRELLDNVFRRHSPRWVFHIAAYAAEGLSPFIRNFNARNNVEGSENIITSCINHDVECLVFTSSIAAYGDQPPPFTEETPLAPCDPYGAAKAFTEASLKNAHAVHGLNSVVFRPYNVYAERQNLNDLYRNVIGIFMRACRQGMELNIFGDGEQTRAFSYISDVAPAIASAVDKRECWNETFNIGGATHHSVNELAVAVSRAMGTTVKLRHLPPRHEAAHAYCSNGKAKLYFKDTMKDVPLSEGLSRMAKWAKTVILKPAKPFTEIEITKNLPPSWASLS